MSEIFIATARQLVASDETQSTSVHHQKSPLSTTINNVSSPDDTKANQPQQEECVDKVAPDEDMMFPLSSAFWNIREAAYNRLKADRSADLDIEHWSEDKAILLEVLNATSKMKELAPFTRAYSSISQFRETHNIGTSLVNLQRHIMYLRYSGITKMICPYFPEAMSELPSFRDRWYDDDLYNSIQRLERRLERSYERSFPNYQIHRSTRQVSCVSLIAQSDIKTGLQDSDEILRNIRDLNVSHGRRFRASLSVMFVRGDALKLASTLYNDLLNIPVIVKETEQGLGRVLVVIIKILIDLLFQHGPNQGKHWKSWIPADLFHKIRNEVLLASIKSQNDHSHDWLSRVDEGYLSFRFTKKILVLEDNRVENVPLFQNGVRSLFGVFNDFLSCRLIPVQTSERSARGLREKLDIIQGLTSGKITRLDIHLYFFEEYMGLRLAKNGKTN